MSVEGFWSDVAACDRLDDDFWFPDVLTAAECERALSDLAEARAVRVARWGERYVRIMEEHDARESVMAKAEVLRVEVGFDGETKDLAQALIDSLGKARYDRLGRDPLPPASKMSGQELFAVREDWTEEEREGRRERSRALLAEVGRLPWSPDEPGQRDATDGVLCDIGAERARQIAQLGYSLDLDDAKAADELALSAACLVEPGSWWKHPDGLAAARRFRRRELVKAAALLVAEIERLDRIEAP